MEDMHKRIIVIMMVLMDVKVEAVAVVVIMVDFQVKQLVCIQMQVVVPEAPVEPTAWENFWAFMVGLFA